MQKFSSIEPGAPASEIAARLGLHRAGHGWRGDCPLCSYSNALAIDQRDGRTLAWCANCQDSAALARLLRGHGALPERRPPDPAERPADVERQAERIERARLIWDGAEALTGTDPASLYLQRRCIGHAISSLALRWRRDCPHVGGSRRIALIAAITGADGKFKAIQRIYIKPDGTKADIEPQKASLGPTGGGAVRLQDCITELVISEGVETSAAAGALLGMPAWAAVSAGNMAKSLMLPVEIRSIVICADHDAPGLAAAEDAARRWQGEGRAVRILRAVEPGRDANDVIREAVR